MIKNIKLFVTEWWQMDGGVAFGVVPKTIWYNLYPSDENNNLPLVNRLLLIETENRLLLVNTGFGDKQKAKYYQYKFITQRKSLETCLNEIGYSLKDVTDVLYTHLHDDHCGGGTYRAEDGQIKPLFPNANYWVTQKQYEWALNPNLREKVVFFPENSEPLANSGQLRLIKPEEQPFEHLDIYLHHLYGHTMGMIVPQFKFQNRTFIYVSDFIPLNCHVHLPYISSIDIQPLVSLQEKKQLLELAALENYILIYEHDVICELSGVSKTEKGYKVEKCFQL